MVDHQALENCEPCAIRADRPDDRARLLQPLLWLAVLAAPIVAVVALAVPRRPLATALGTAAAGLGALGLCLALVLIP